jgi:Kef-type K+ transport system membrane component KefB
MRALPAMTSLELLVVLLLLAMMVPDACAWLGRPALAYPAFVVFGLLVGPLLRPEVGTLLQEAGQIGFVLLLFEVGLEIDLPVARELRRPLAYVARWVLPQYPVVFALARLAGLTWAEAAVSAAAIGACSVGMAHGAWKHHAGLEGETRVFVLRVMVLLEVVAVVVLAVETAALGRGTSGWTIAAKLAGMAVVVYACSRLAVPLARLMQRVLERATHWRLHLVTLLVLVACAIGDRLGLAGPKTAFFLGMFSSRVEHDGKSLEDYLAPISRRFLIPLFFLSLGTQVPLAMLASRAALLALAAAALLIAGRQMLHARWAPTGGGPDTYLLFCPNFTLVALAANSLLHGGETEPAAVAWLLLTGLFVTLIALLALPRRAVEPAPGF